MFWDRLWLSEIINNNMDIRKIPLNKLFLDPINYRLRSNPLYKDIPDLTDDKIVGKALQQRTFNLIAGKNKSEIKDLIESFKTNGYLKVDNVLVRKLEDSENYVVVEGNRRIAALKVLEESYNEGFEIGNLNAEIFNIDEGLEVVVYNYDKIEEYLILMGLRHVSGNKKWDRYNQAKLIAELNLTGHDVQDIANKLGITNRRAVQDQLNAYFAIQAFINSDSDLISSNSYNPHDRFMLFVEVLLKRRVREWLNWDDVKKEFQNKENLNRFYSWITPSYKVSDDEDAGLNEGELLDPIIVNHKEIRLLDEIINDEDSLSRLEDTRSITEAVEQNNGYTKRKFSQELKNAESILKNIKFGPTLEIDSSDIKTLENIKLIVDKILSVEDAQSWKKKKGNYKST